MNARLIPLLLSALLFAACKKDDSHGHAPAGGQPNAGGDDHGHGERKPLGPLTVGAHTFEVVQFGDVAAGKEAVVQIDFAAGKPLPGTARAWVGVESGEGSMKAKMDKEGDRALHAHVDVPKAIPAGSKVWVEIEESGKTARGSVAWK